MEESAYITALIASGFYLVASLRLIRLSRRTRERPELLLGLYFGFSGLYYLGNNFPSLIGFEAWPPRISLAIDWIYSIGVLPYLLFIRRVFRPNDGWARIAVRICSAILLLGTAMGALVNGRVEFTFDNPWFLVQWLGYTAPCGWVGCEAMLCWQSARKRARIGLCPPVVANRYLLLALFGGFQVLACLADLYVAHDLGSNQTIAMITDAMLGGAEIASVAVLWLAFFPPPFYADWITRSAVILPTPMEG